MVFETVTHFGDAAEPGSPRNERNIIRNREPIRIKCCLLLTEIIRRYGSYFLAEYESCSSLRLQQLALFG